MKKSFLALWFAGVLLAYAQPPQKVSFSGVVCDKNKKPIENVEVTLVDSDVGAITDTKGYFTLQTTPRVYEVSYRHVSYKPFDEDVALLKTMVRDTLYLFSQSYQTQSIVSFATPIDSSSTLRTDIPHLNPLVSPLPANLLQAYWHASPQVTKHNLTGYTFMGMGKEHMRLIVDDVEMPIYTGDFYSFIHTLNVDSMSMPLMPDLRYESFGGVINVKTLLNAKKNPRRSVTLGFPEGVSAIARGTSSSLNGHYKLFGCNTVFEDFDGLLLPQVSQVHTILTSQMSSWKIEGSVLYHHALSHLQNTSQQKGIFEENKMSSFSLNAFLLNDPLFTFNYTYTPITTNITYGGLTSDQKSLETHDFTLDTRRYRHQLRLSMNMMNQKRMMSLEVGLHHDLNTHAEEAYAVDADREITGFDGTTLTRTNFHQSYATQKTSLYATLEKTLYGVRWNLAGRLIGAWSAEKNALSYALGMHYDGLSLVGAHLYQFAWNKDILIRKNPLLTREIKTLGPEILDLMSVSYKAKWPSIVGEGGYSLTGYWKKGYQLIRNLGRELKANQSFMSLFPDTPLPDINLNTGDDHILGAYAQVSFVQAPFFLMVGYHAEHITSRNIIHLNELPVDWKNLNPPFSLENELRHGIFITPAVPSSSEIPHTIKLLLAYEKKSFSLTADANISSGARYTGKKIIDGRLTDGLPNNLRLPPLVTVNLSARWSSKKIGDGVLTWWVGVNNLQNLFDQNNVMGKSYSLDDGKIKEKNILGLPLYGTLGVGYMGF